MYGDCSDRCPEATADSVLWRKTEESNQRRRHTTIILSALPLREAAMGRPLCKPRCCPPAHSSCVVALNPSYPEELQSEKNSYTFSPWPKLR